MADFDVRYMDSTVIQDFLMGLKYSKIPKYLITDYIRSSKTKLASELWERMFPLFEEQHYKMKDRFHGGCIDFYSPDCKSLSYPIAQQLSDITHNNNKWMHQTEAHISNKQVHINISYLNERSTNILTLTFNDFFFH